MTECSSASRQLNEPLAGTAAPARSWVVIEQPGPWGRSAVTDSHLDHDLGMALERAASAHVSRVALIRRPGRHPDSRGATLPRQVFLASTLPGRGWLLGAQLVDPAELLDLPWSALADADAGAVVEALPMFRPVADPLLFVCTNARRDRCCAVLGRPIAARLHDELGDQIWETSHTGGHRFAPTSLILPSGLMHGRLDVRRARSVLAAAQAGDVCLAGYRGRSTYGRAGQAAEAAVRETTGETGLDDLTVVETPRSTEQARVIVTHVDGRVWVVEVARRLLRPARPESCGQAAVTPEAAEVLAIKLALPARSGRSAAR